MLTKRIIPCLDIKDGKTVKGINFKGLENVGDPVMLAKEYCRQMADELVFLDISATIEGRRTFASLVSRIAAEINIPFTVGGGISSVEDAALLLKAGADKISINSAAVARPALISELRDRFGSQCVVVAVDARVDGGNWKITTHGGTRLTGIELFDWVCKVQDYGAGEILFTSMDHDGTKKGYACDVYQKMSEILTIPVIASGGAGCEKDIYDVLAADGGNADAALAASIFHYGEIRIPDLKKYLDRLGIPVRLHL